VDVKGAKYNHTKRDFSISKFESGEKTISVNNLEKACSLVAIYIKV